MEGELEEAAPAPTSSPHGLYKEPGATWCPRRACGAASAGATGLPHNRLGPGEGVARIYPIKHPFDRARVAESNRSAAVFLAGLRFGHGRDSAFAGELTRTLLIPSSTNHTPRHRSWSMAVD